jgi:L-iditol 2-dehydrogenase
MKRVLIQRPNVVVVQEAADPKPGPGEVCVNVAYCGICGSDVHAYQGDHPFIPLPATPGHEFSGTISAIGKGAQDFKVGDRIVCEPNLVCGKCYNCRIGRYNICENLRVVGCQGDGAMADYILIPAEKAVPIPDRLSLRDAVLVEPLAVGVGAVRKAGQLFEKNVVIFGAGTIGLMVLICAKRAGAKHITVVDLVQRRLDLAKKLGADETISPASTDVVGRILDTKPYEGIDVVFECVGLEKSIRDAIAVVRKGGRIVVAGVFGKETTVRMADVQDREIELIGTIMYVRRDVTDAVELIADGYCRAEHFISKEFPLEKAEDAFQEALHTQKNMKVIFSINP